MSNRALKRRYKAIFARGLNDGLKGSVSFHEADLGIPEEDRLAWQAYWLGHQIGIQHWVAKQQEAKK